MPEYANGARSFEKICIGLKPEKKEDGQRFCRSRLPADEVLAMNLGGDGRHEEALAEFKGIMDRESGFQALAGKLAPAIHKSYIPLAERDNPNNKPYEELAAKTKQDNHEAAMRIPWLLSLVGLYVVENAGRKHLPTRRCCES